MAINLFEGVEYTGDANNFAWRYENPKVKKNTTVIVRPNQIAFWVSNGVLVETMGPGKHKLDGNYVQGLSWIAAQFHGGEVPSRGEVWFASSGMRSVKWGTPAQIGINVAYPGFTTQAKVAARGDIQVRLSKVNSAEDADRVWNYIWEMNEQYGSGDPDNPAVSVVGLSRYIQERILQPLQAGFTNIFRVVKFGEQYEHLPALSAFILKENLAPAIAQWGLVVENFQIAQLETDEASRAAFNQWLSRLNGAEAAKFEEQRAAEARRYGIEQEGYGMAASRRAQGYTYQEERQFDVLQQAAGNAGVGGSFMSAGVGLAMGGAVGGVMGGMMANAAADAQASRQQPAPDIPPPATSSTQGASGVSVGLPAEPPTPAAVSQTASAPETKFCINCGAKIPRAAKFCAECGGAQ